MRAAILSLTALLLTAGALAQGPAPGYGSAADYAAAYAAGEADKAAADPVGYVGSKGNEEAIGDEAGHAAYVACWAAYDAGAYDALAAACAAHFTPPGTEGPANQPSEAPLNETAAVEEATKVVDETVGAVEDIVEDPGQAPSAVARVLAAVGAFVTWTVGAVAALAGGIVGVLDLAGHAALAPVAGAVLVSGLAVDGLATIGAGATGTAADAALAIVAGASAAAAGVAVGVAAAAAAVATAAAAVATAVATGVTVAFVAVGTALVAAGKAVGLAVAAGAGGVAGAVAAAASAVAALVAAGAGAVAGGVAAGAGAVADAAEATVGAVGSAVEAVVDVVVDAVGGLFSADEAAAPTHDAPVDVPDAADELVDLDLPVRL